MSFSTAQANLTVTQEAEEMTQWVQHLWSRHEDQSSLYFSAYNPSNREAEIRIPRERQLARLVKSESSGSMTLPQIPKL